MDDILRELRDMLRQVKRMRVQVRRRRRTVVLLYGYVAVRSTHERRTKEV